MIQLLRKNVNGKSHFPCSSLERRRTIWERMKFGEKVRLARRQLKLTQEQAARRAGISKRYLIDIESEEANLTVDVLLRVAEALDIREHNFGSLSAYFGAGTKALVLAKLETAETALRELRRALGSEADGDLVSALANVAGSTDAPAASFQFVESIGASDLIDRRVDAMRPEHLYIPQALFRAVDFSYPVPDGGTVLRASVLGDSMAPALRAGDEIRIDTAVRAPNRGVVLAVHGDFGSALGSIAPDGDPTLLLRTQGAPVRLKPTCVVYGTVEKVA
jgi:transcriptional regulator with XRE-family HTH domain